jgi:tetratricopeptide (TPR) repeat protein
MTVSPPLRAVLLILIAGGVVYSNSLQNGFTFDDHAIVERNPVVHTSDIAEIWTSPYWPGGWRYGLYRPVTTTSYALNRILTGPGPAGFHAVNIALHVLTALMVFVVVRIWLGEGGATTAALIFALHPVQTEAVNGIVGRADILAVLLALIAWWLYRRSGMVWRLGSVLAFAAALLAKESALVLPAILIVEDAARAHTARAIVRRWRRYLPYAIVGLGFLVLRVALVGSLGLPETPRLVDNPLAAVSAVSRWLTAIGILARYVALVLAPLHLSPDYTFNQIPALTSPFDLWFLAGVALVFGSLVLLRYRWSQPGGFGVGVFWMALFPLSNLVFIVGTNLGERLLYMPMIGVCLIAGWGYDTLRDRCAGCPVWLAALVICLGLGVRTGFRNADWQDDLTLFTAASLTSPGSAKIHLNLGNALSEVGDDVGAMRAYDRALDIHPGYTAAHYNRGVLLQERGQLAEARGAYEQTLHYDAKHVGALVNRGIVAARTGDGRSAIRDLSRAIQIDTHRVDAWYNYGIVLSRAGINADARMAFRKVLNHDVTHEDAAIELVGLYKAEGITDSVIVTYERLLSHHPSAYRAAYNFGVELERLGRVEKAIEAFSIGAQDGSERGAMSLYRAARLFDRVGRREAAHQAYSDFLRRWKKADAFGRSAREASDRLSGS